MVGSNPGLHVLSCVIAGTLGSSLHGGFKPLFGCVLSCLNAGSLGSTLTSGVKPGLGVCFHVLLLGHWGQLCVVGEAWFGCVL